MNKANGFSLVELMIALALGSVVTAGVVQLFVANSETHNLLIGQSRMQESARFGLDFIGREVRQAGYRGCFSDSEDPFSTIDPISNLPYEFDIRFGIQGFEASGPDTWLPALTVLPNTDADLAINNGANRVFKTTYNYGAGAGIDLDTVVSGTDVITIRHISKVEAALGGYQIPGNATEYGRTLSAEDPIVVGVPEGWAEFDEDHLAVVHDCEKASVFRVTTANPWGRNGDGSPMGAPAPVGGSETTDLVIGHDVDDIGSATRNTTTRITDEDPFDTSALVSAIESHTFFIAPGEGVNNSGDAPLSLWRKSGLEPPLELVEGVENLQFLYGSDTDGDGVPNQYLQANLVADWQQIVTVRVTLVVNSIDSVGGTSPPTLGCDIQGCVDGEVDGLIRRTFSQTILLRN